MDHRMRKLLIAVSASVLVAGAAFAQQGEINKVNPNAQQFRVKNEARPGGGGSNLVYHSGGPVLTVAHVVNIFWGPSFNDTTSADYSYARTIQNYRNNFGTSAYYNTITQYYQNINGTSYIQLSNLSANSTNNPDWFDTSAPPTNVTDSAVQSEVKKYLQSHSTDYSAVYEVFIPRTSYSSSGTSDSCGGPNLAYCAYHSHYNDATGQAVKYSIQPYPSCSGCVTSGFSDVQNQEHFISHETREAVTDPLGSTWYDRSGNEADDKCAWSPTPFVDGTTGYAYQYEWSNANSGCIKSK